MPSARVTSAEFEQYLAEAQVLAVDAITTFALFCFLTSPKQKTKYAEALAKHNQVFSLISPAAFSMLILSLHKPLEDARNPVSIRSCISMALQLSRISRDTARSLKGRVKKVVPIWEKVDVLRNSLIAHRDCGISVSKVFENANISPKDLKELALAYWEVLNALRAANKKSAFDVNVCGTHLFGALNSFMTDLLYAAKRR